MAKAKRVPTRWGVLGGFKMADRSAEEIANDCTSEFGLEDGQIVLKLTNSVSQLSLEWRAFLYFFCGPKERVAVLNQASGLTAQLLQNLLWDNALLKIRKLTDPAIQSGKLNLSLEQLVRIAKDNKQLNISSSFAGLKLSCKTSRLYADKYIAHTDLAHAIGDDTVMVVRRDTTAAVKAIMEFVHGFHSRVRDVHYKLLPLTSVNDEQQFLERIFLGNNAANQKEAEKIAKAKAGDWQALNEPLVPSWIWDSAFRDDPF